jgi:hypothetical protein
MAEPLTVAIDRRYQVFISSTFRDLADRRKDVIQVIFERGHIPIALERFSAADESDLRVIMKAVSACQIFILIVGHRYGELVPDANISFTELEYNLAQERNLLTLVLQMHPEEVNKQRKLLDPNNERDRHEVENAERLRLFLDKLKKHHRQYWVPGEDFKYDVLRAFDDNVPTCGRRGWIPEPEDPTIIETADNEFIVDLVTELKGFDVLYRRVSFEAEKKRTLAKCFRQKYADRILKHNVSLFFESGSTVAYAAKALAEPLSKHVGINGSGEPSIRLSTNNVLAYLLLWLKLRIPCSPFPWSAPSEKTYGAWYGGLEEKEAQNPLYDGTPLDSEALGEIKKLMNHQFRPSLKDGPALLLGAASGLQIGAEPKLVFREGLDAITKAVLTEQLKTCRGPHVGSYHNKVFKRFMYATGIPIVIFIEAAKIDCEIVVGKCHFILDRDFTWETFCNNHPVAFCVGCTHVERQPLEQMFLDLGFSISDGCFPGAVTAFVARNAEFIKRFEELTVSD